MAAELKTCDRGGYQFLPGIEPYSSGVIAARGHEIVHARLSEPVAWKQGLISARRHLEQIGLSHHALCGVELRCSEPHSMDGFIEFNQQYRALLDDWDVPVDGENPIARTNVAPVCAPPDQTVLYGFSYAQPSDVNQPTFVVAGGGELPHRELNARHIVRCGDVSADALLEKGRCVIDIMQTRLDRLNADVRLVSSISVYCAHPTHRILQEVIIPGLAAAARIGVQCFYARPPIRDIEFEMDLRGVRREFVVDLR